MEIDRENLVVSFRSIFADYYFSPQRSANIFQKGVGGLSFRKNGGADLRNLVTFAEGKKVTMMHLMLGDNDLFDRDGNQRMTASDLLMSVVINILGRPGTTVTDVVFSHLFP